MRTVDKIRRWVSVSEEEDRYPLNVAMEEELGYNSQSPEAEREVLRMIASDIEREMREARQREAKWKTGKAEAEQRCQQLEQVAKEMYMDYEQMEVELCRLKGYGKMRDRYVGATVFKTYLIDCGVSIDD